MNSSRQLINVIWKSIHSLNEYGKLHGQANLFRFGRSRVDPIKLHAYLMSPGGIQIHDASSLERALMWKLEVDINESVKSKLIWEALQRFVLQGNTAPDHNQFSWRDE